jgi:hypothetical protein
MLGHVTVAVLKAATALEISDSRTFWQKIKDTFKRKDKEEEEDGKNNTVHGL